MSARDPRHVLGELAEGSRFELRPDETDPRFDLVTMRIPVRPHGGAPTNAPIALTGQTANEETLEYYLAQAAGILDQLHAHETASRVREAAAVHRTMQRARRRDADARSRCDA